LQPQVLTGGKRVPLESRGEGKDQKKDWGRPGVEGIVQRECTENKKPSNQKNELEGVFYIGVRWDPSYRAKTGKDKKNVTALSETG